MTTTLEAELFAFGLLVGCYGSLVGAGGGFLMVPVFLLVLHFTPPVAAGTSLTVVFANAAAGSFLYFRQRRIDLRSALQFAGATVPGSIAGVFLLRVLSARTFEIVFGALLCALGLFMALAPRQRQEAIQAPDEIIEARASRGTVIRQLVDREGACYTYQFSWRLGMALSLVVGILSSLLGIGGGPLHVPAMVYLLGFPIHIAVATSHCVLALSAFIASSLNLAMGQVHLVTALVMGSGAVLGARAGTSLAGRLQGGSILRFLSLALLALGIWLIARTR